MKVLLKFRYLVVLLGMGLPLNSTEIEVVEVVETTPFGAQVRRDNLAGELQVATEEDLRRDRTLSLADYMNENFTSVLINEAQSNPLQPDIQYRGFIGSPLLGLPQGLAVYQDGVRINEPFGDTVSWALIPNNAIADVAFIPGSNPLFGRNALGGSLSYKTKTGFESPTTDLVAAVGSYGLERFDLSGGFSNDGWAAYGAGSFFREDGWRDFSPSDRNQWFGSVSKRGERSETNVRVTRGSTRLIGNGPLPVDLLVAERDSVFTRPDQTKNDALIVSVDSEYRFDGWSVHFNGHRRRSDIDTFNGDDSDYEECDNDDEYICLEDDDDEQLITDKYGDKIYAADSLEGATINRSTTKQESNGYGVEIRSPRWTLGVHREVADIDFSSSTELGALDSTRRAIPGGIFVGDAFTELGTEVIADSFYAFSSWPITSELSAQISGRWGNTRLTLNDRIGTALDGDHSFRRLNPAVGMTWRPLEGTRFYLSYSESNRVPSPVELTCADEDAPCRLPNAFLADPPLKDVVAKTWETGIHRYLGWADWNATIFRTMNKDDIIFISAGRLTNQGYFDNVGQTQRIGFELSLSGDIDNQVSWYAKYAWLKATFEEAFRVSSANHPKALEGEIGVSRGDRLPLVPQNQLKLGMDYGWQQFRLGANVQYRSASYLRGDEGNIASKLKGYVVVNADLSYEWGKHRELFVKVRNILDSEFETFGLFGEADEVLGDDFSNPRFLSPGAPRAFTLGFQMLFGSR